MGSKGSWFQRLILPGFAFKALVIGGGYATGRELATYFLPSGPIGGLYGMGVAALVWSLVCVLTFRFALKTGSRDYRAFFLHLLGPFWPVFEAVYLLTVILVLAVFAAAASTIGQSLFGWPPAAGIAVLIACISLATSWGSRSVEQVFKYVSIFLYGTYAVFVVLALSKFGDRTLAAFAGNAPTSGWALGGLTYAGYNIVGAVLILPVLRHLSTPRDAVIAGLLAGPMAMLPAVLFYVCMMAFPVEIGDQALPSDFLLSRMQVPAFRVIFQIMVMAALVESATGGIHAINERLSAVALARAGRSLGAPARFAVTLAILLCSIILATRFGLVALIATGYQWLAYAILAIYVLPLLLVSLKALIPGPAPVGRPERP